MEFLKLFQTGLFPNSYSEVAIWHLLHKRAKMVVQFCANHLADITCSHFILQLSDEEKLFMQFDLYSR